MSGIWGKNLQVNIFGESHGTAIGIVINNLPSGIALDMQFIEKQMARRAPNGGLYSTPRKEADKVEIVSGILDGKTTGTPLCAMIYNCNTKSKDYSSMKDLMRPSHSDYGYFVKTGGNNDYRGGGHSSGRITAPLVFCGAICQQILASKGIVVGAHILAISNNYDSKINSKITKEQLLSMKELVLPLINTSIVDDINETITEARNAMDSVGGQIECCVLGVPAGYGDPFFDSIESRISSIMFSVPAVKGIEFGNGYEMTKMRGSQANDPYDIVDGKIVTTTNNNGGVLGGISNGMPIIFNVAIKPTPSIFIQQDTVNVATMTKEKLSIEGRHDPCIVVRAVPVIEAVTAMAIYDILED